MTNLEQRVQEAFDEIKVPQSVKENTLQAIEAARLQSEAHTPEVSSVSDAPAKSEKRATQRRFHAERVKKFIAVAACFALCFVSLSGFRMYTQPTAYVGIEVNPSIELTLNRFDIVIDERALNEEGEAVLGEISLVNKSYTQAIDMLFANDSLSPYLANEESFVAVNVYSEDQSQEEELCIKSDEQLATLDCAGVCEPVDAETRQEAFDAGVGVSRYEAASRLVDLDPAITLEQAVGMSMKQLRDQIALYEGDASVSGLGNGNGNGEGAGVGNGDGQGSGNGQGSGQAGGTGEAQGSGNAQGNGQASGSAQGNGTGQASESGQGNGGGQGGKALR